MRWGQCALAAAPQFRHDPVIQGTAADVVEGAHRQHVVLEPTDQQGHVFGEGHRLRLGLASIAELPYQRRILAAPLPVLQARGLAVFQTTACGDGFVRHDSPGNRPSGVAGFCKDAWKTSTATSGDHPARPRLVRPAILPGEIGDGGVGSEAPFAQFQQAYALASIGVAVLFLN